MDPKCVLIVDDSRVSRMLVRAYFEERRPNWWFFEASNGLEAIDIARREPLHLITMDVNMPGLSGLRAAEEIRLLRPAVRLVVLTANLQSSVRQRAEALGAEFVLKPITEAMVAQIVESLERN